MSPKPCVSIRCATHRYASPYKTSVSCQKYWKPMSQIFIGIGINTMNKPSKIYWDRKEYIDELTG